MSKSKHQKQDVHTSKVDKIREIVRNTEENLKETEFSKEFVDIGQRAAMNQQNARRKQSIEELKEEIKEEREKM